MSDVAHTEGTLREEIAGEEEVAAVRRLPRPLLAAGLAALVLVLVSAGWWALAGRAAQQPAGVAQGAPRVGSPAPDFELQDAQTGQMVRLSSLRGRPVWINFWASWCDGCRQEMPYIKKAFAQYKDRGLAVLGVNVQESPDAVRSFTSSNGFDWTFLLDSDGRIADRYFASGVPEHFFVGKDGIIKAMLAGKIEEAAIKDYLATIMGQ